MITVRSMAVLLAVECLLCPGAGFWGSAPAGAGLRSPGLERLVPWSLGLRRSGRCVGADRYVSPEGSPGGAGTREAPWDIASTLAGGRDVRPGDRVVLLEGTYRRRPEAEFAVKLVGEADRPIHVLPDRGARATVDGGLSIEEPSAHVWLQDLEVLVSENFSMPREIDEPGSSPESYGRPWGGVHVRGGKDCKLIHLVIHDCAQGISAWSAAVDTEIYGCLIHENGWKAPDRGHGHAIYTQNEKGRKVIRHSILSAKYEGSYTLHAYGSSRAFVDGYVIDGNIAYGRGPFLIGGGRPSRDIRVTDNALHGVDLRVGYTAPHNEDCVVRGNIVVGGSLAITRYRSVVEEGNIVVPRGSGDLKKRLSEKGANGRWFPSRYRPDRAHLAAYGVRGGGGEDQGEGEGGERVEILAGPFLRPGDRYRLLDPKDFFGNPVEEGTCEGETISVPVPGGFGAFVVLRTQAGGARAGGHPPEDPAPPR